MRKDPRVYLVQILERIERITLYTTGGKSAFLSDPLIQDAVISAVLPPLEQIEREIAGDDGSRE